MVFTRGPDRDVTAEIPLYRQIIPYIMRGRNESAVYYQTTVNVEPVLALCNKLNNQQDELRYTLFHFFLRAICVVITQRPRLNRYIMGRRFWQRDGIYLSFAAKKRFDDESPLVVIKLRVSSQERMEDMVRRIHQKLRQGRSDDKSYTDKELALILSLPRCLINMIIRLQKWADYYNLLPHSFRENDPMYASAFLANLGSLGLDAAWHHLYEYGDIPFFITVGKIKNYISHNGNQEMAYKGVTLKITYDERIEDGFYVTKALEMLHHYFRKPETLLQPLNTQQESLAFRE